jgi:hypothetical protein
MQIGCDPDFGMEICGWLGKTLANYWAASLAEEYEGKPTGDGTDFIIKFDCDQKE